MSDADKAPCVAKARKLKAGYLETLNAYATGEFKKGSSEVDGHEFDKSKSEVDYEEAEVGDDDDQSRD